MALTINYVLTETMTAAGAVATGLFIKGNGTVCGAGEKAAGVSVSAAEKSSDVFGVCVIGKVIATSGAAVTAGAKIEADANGKAITFSTGECNGIALSTCSGADQELQILVR
jgi:hypothetical protein